MPSQKAISLLHIIVTALLQCVYCLNIVCGLMRCVHLRLQINHNPLFVILNKITLPHKLTQLHEKGKYNKGKM